MRRSLVHQMLHYLARPHEAPARAPVGGPAAWRGADLAAGDPWRVTLDPAEVREIERAVAAACASGRPLSAMTRDDLPLPTLAPRIAAWRREIARGGRSRIASSVAVHDELMRRRPDLVPELYRPFLLDTKSEGGLRYFPIVPCCFAGGALRTFYHADYFRSVERHPDAPRLTARQRELLDVYDEIANSPEVCLEMDLAPGDVQLLSNHTVIHGRKAFEDRGEPGERRHLLRLWLSLPGADGAGGAWGPMARLVARLGVERARQGIAAHLGAT